LWRLGSTKVNEMTFKCTQILQKDGQNYSIPSALHNITLDVNPAVVVNYSVTVVYSVY